MNIYATGFNPADCNALKRAPRVAIFQAFVEMMKQMELQGEQLTWRATKVGDQLPSETDAVIVSVMLPRSLNCPYAMGAIWTISEALRLDIPLVIYLCDWAFFSAHSEFRSIAKAGTPYLSKTIGGALQYNEPPAMIAKHGDELIDVCRQWGDTKSKLWKKAQVLVPRYTNWGDVRIVQNLLPGANDVLTFDPSPILVDYLSVGGLDYMSNPDRKHAWLLPSLLKDNRWIDQQQLELPIDRYGPKGFEVVKTERDVHQLYRNYTGAICHPYPTAGSGWWRSRWIHAALAGTVLLCDDKDDQAVGIEYSYSGAEYEEMTPSRLDKVALSQHLRMMSLLQLNQEVLLDQIYAPFSLAGAITRS